MELSKSALQDIYLGIKTCNVCQKQKDINCFRLHTNSKRYTYYQKKCKDCYNKYHLELHHKHSEKEEYKEYKKRKRNESYYKDLQKSRKQANDRYTTSWGKRANRKQVDNLTDSYIVSTICHRSSLSRHVVKNDNILINAYRFNILLKRTIKNKKL